MDFNLLKFLYDDNQKVEPEWYIPIIPMVLVNGAEGIGTGWACKIPNYDPREIVNNINRMLNHQDPLPMGTDKTPALISDYKEYHTDATVKFVVRMSEEKLAQAEAVGLHKVFKLQSSLTCNSMVLFDHMGCLKRYDSVQDILKEFFELRLHYYKLRKDWLLGSLGAEASKLSNQARFVLEKIEGKISIGKAIKLVKGKVGKPKVKKMNLEETMPSPFGRRVDPPTQPIKSDAAKKLTKKKKVTTQSSPIINHRDGLLSEQPLAFNETQIQTKPPVWHQRRGAVLSRVSTEVKASKPKYTFDFSEEEEADEEENGDNDVASSPVRSVKDDFGFSDTKDRDSDQNEDEEEEENNEDSYSSPKKKPMNVLTGSCLYILIVLQMAPGRTVTKTPARSSPPTPAAQRLTKYRQQRKVMSQISQ
ncbi:hypothetical protein XENOCAPTIV_029898 [Xenoophorus captivus]|uniref:Topo IIA-type catalytic domain-containing protein n=1 Tax=Xenoophorus captivus TaxID=1517983 RepID=A0ABV0R5X4_9TELE